MRQSVLVTLAAAGLVLFAAMPGGTQNVPEDLQTILVERFRPSRIELENPARRGSVVLREQMLTLMADRVPAKPFRVIQTDGVSGPVHVHVMDFAKVEIWPDGRVKAEPAPLALDRGTLLVVLGVQTRPDRISLFAHTADPVPAAWGRSDVYGCTEFVFKLTSGALEVASAADTVFELIGRWLAPAGERFCAPRFASLCVEP